MLKDVCALRLVLPDQLWQWSPWLKRSAGSDKNPMAACSGGDEIAKKVLHIDGIFVYEFFYGLPLTRIKVEPEEIGGGRSDREGMDSSTTKISSVGSK